MYVQYPQQTYKSQNTLFLPKRLSSKSVSFCAEPQDEFVKGTKHNIETHFQEIEALNNELQNCKLFVSSSKAKDILSSAVDISKALWQEKKNLDKSWSDISDAKEYMISCSAKRARDKYGIENKEYGLNDCTDRVEQLAVLTKFLNNNKDNFLGLTSSTPEEIACALRNDSGRISNESLSFIEKLVEVYGYCDVSKLIDVIQIVKNDVGDMDLEKMSAFIAYFSYKKLKNADVSDAVDFIKRNYPQSQNRFEENLESTQKMEDYIVQINESTDIDDLIDRLDLKTVGFISKIKIKNILKTISDFSYEHNRKREYNLNRIPRYFGNKETKELRAESAIRGFYDVYDTYASEYLTLGEQMRVIGNFLNSNEEKLCSVTKDTTESIVKSLQNKDG
ncbi:MAG: hypothetical protein IJ583_05440, partial [Firmicutes bacterium]|nr:hypothetical protein [Bacillota bacterium]